MARILRRLPLSADQFTFANRDNESIDPRVRERSGDHRLESYLVIDRVVGNKNATGHHSRHHLFVAQAVDLLLSIEKAEADAIDLTHLVKEVAFDKRDDIAYLRFGKSF